MVGVWDSSAGYCGVVVGVWNSYVSYCVVVAGVWDSYVDYCGVVLVSGVLCGLLWCSSRCLRLLCGLPLC